MGIAVTSEGVTYSCARSIPNYTLQSSNGQYGFLAERVLFSAGMIAKMIVKMRATDLLLPALQFIDKPRFS